MNLLIKTNNIGCESGWTRFTVGGQVKSLKRIGDYELQEAKSRCAKCGASVPLPRNRNENEDYRVAFEELDSTFVALGLNDVATEGVWRDNNGNRVTYTNWDSGQPNNYDGNQDYVGMSTGLWGKWWDERATITSSIVCEIESSSRALFISAFILVWVIA